MLWERKTLLKTFRIDASEWAQFLAAIESSPTPWQTPSHKLRSLIMGYVNRQAEARAPSSPASSSPASSPAKRNTKKPRPSKKVKKASRS